MEQNQPIKEKDIKKGNQNTLQKQMSFLTYGKNSKKKRTPLLDDLYQVISEF